MSAQTPVVGRVVIGPAYVKSLCAPRPIVRAGCGSPTTARIPITPQHKRRVMNLVKQAKDALLILKLEVDDLGIDQVVQTEIEPALFAVCDLECAALGQPETAVPTPIRR